MGGNNCHSNNNRNFNEIRRQRNRTTQTFEGCELSAYQDSVGVWTIGYGHTKGVFPGMTITQGQAEQMLLTELEEYEGYIENMVAVPLTQNQFDALVVWVYNLGPTNVKNSTLRKELNSGNYTAAGNEILRSF